MLGQVFAGSLLVPLPGEVGKGGGHSPGCAVTSDYAFHVSTLLKKKQPWYMEFAITPTLSISNFIDQYLFTDFDV